MIETHVERARQTAESERASFADERAAYEQFRRRAADLSTTELGDAGTLGPTGAVTTRTATETKDAGCQAVREAFAETVRPFSVEDVTDEPLLATIRAELGDGVALALAPTTDTGFTARTREAVLAACRDRRQAIDATTAALDSEIDSLRAATAVIEEITEWLAATDETALSSLEFEGLADRHDRLSAFRTRCEQCLADRQELLGETTGRTPGADVTHGSLVRFCYQSFPVDYPVLSTVTRLYELLGDCQRVVRAHLTCRG